MKSWLIMLAAACSVVGPSAAGFFFWPASIEPVVASAEQPHGAALVARGEYLVNAADCAACHTAPGGKPFAGGLAFALPFGTLYSPNITPDKDTGIGGWTDAEFVRALHQGVGRNGEDLYPAFPYPSFALLSTDDALAMRAFLQTLPPSRATPPGNTIRFPFNLRFVMRAWKLLYLPRGRFEANPSRDRVWNRGAYLAEALAHCGECHTPRNLMFATKSDAKFAGAVVDGLKAYNITPDPQSGIGKWTDQELADYLASGHAEGHGGASGNMAEAVDLSLRHLSSADIDSIVTYLRTVPPRRSGDPEVARADPPSLANSTAWSTPPGQSSSEGLRIFESACASCHAWNGEGQQSPYAALRGARTVNDPDGANLVRVVLEGVRIRSPLGDMAMPAFAQSYSDAEIASLSNYVLGQFGATQGRVTATMVARARTE
jgi:mono/diheme cytochrome c family protein